VLVAAGRGVGPARLPAAAQVKVWTDLGESDWSDPVALEAGLLSGADWPARWIGWTGVRRPCGRTGMGWTPAAFPTGR
jgi:hypothetical protein